MVLFEYVAAVGLAVLVEVGVDRGKGGCKFLQGLYVPGLPASVLMGRFLKRSVFVALDWRLFWTPVKMHQNWSRRKAMTERRAPPR